MSRLREFHREAMDAAEKAILLNLEGQLNNALQYWKIALRNELMAIACLDGDTPQPTHSVLYRSAATLALDCGYDGMALALVEIAMSRNPPEEIKQQLLDVQRKAEEKND